MDLSEVFIEAISRCSDFEEGVRVVRGVTSGGLWLIGGTVYRTLASALYGAQDPKVDLDFVADRLVKGVEAEQGWAKTSNKYGHPRLVKGKKNIDYASLGSLYQIRSRRLEPTIENYLSGVPLTVQSVVFDVINQRLVGEIGIKAIYERTVAINRLHSAKRLARFKRKTLKEIISKKSEELGFVPIIP